MRRARLWCSLLAREIRLAIRRLARQPSFWGPAVATLAVGFGGTAAVFTLLHTVVLNPLPYAEPDRLVRLQTAVPGMGAGATWELAKAEYLYFLKNTKAFREMGLYLISGATVGSVESASGQAEQVYTADVSASLPEVLGARPLLGRAITAEDNLPSATPAVWLTRGFWMRRFGGDPTIVGRPILVDGRPTAVAGILGPRAKLPEEEQLPEIRIDLWRPLGLDPAQRPSSSHTFRSIARLAPGVSLAQAQVEIGHLTAQLPMALPSVYTARFMRNTGFTTEVIPLRDDVLGTNGQVLWILFASLLLVLVVACANVASLLLARAESQRRETSVRVALGASRARLLLHSLVETLILTTVAGAIGLLLAGGAVRLMVSLSPADFPRLPEVHLGWASVQLTVIVALGSGLALAFLPLRRGLETASLGADRGSTVSPRQQAARRAFVIAQIAACVVLVAGAALLVQSFHRLTAVHSGMDPRGVLTFRLVLPGARYAAPEAVIAFYRELAARTEALAGVVSTGYAGTLPLTGYDGCSALFAKDHPPSSAQEAPCIQMLQVTPGYFRTLGIPIRGAADWGSAPQTRNAVTSAALAEKFWPAEDSLGKSVQAGTHGESYRIAAVAGDVRANGLDKPPIEALYVQLMSEPPLDAMMVVRVTSGPPERLLPALRSVLADIDPQVPIAAEHSMEGIVASSTARLSYSTLLLAVASAMALVLSTIGVYGLLSFLIACRHSEIAIRMAIGAQAAQVRRIILAEAVGLAVLGVVVGLVASFFVTRSLQSLLFGVSAVDPATLGAVSVFLILIATTASWAPAWLATRVPPFEALRCD
jgi:putative ABC transport system permease protein